ncbi:MAG: type VI secretion system membrane subunit TssM, partial [Gemmatimonadetes bacterium]|nr:type VI secretion system membrane subunit TssM [Gemmatimonadota bacterium]
MKKILRPFSDPRVIIGLVLAVLVALLFTLGPRFGITGETRLLVIIGLMMVAMIVLLLTGGKKRKKKSADIERSLLLEADSLVMSSSGAQRQANEKARDELAKAIDALKKARGAGGRSALHELPWYLVLGRENSGKSTMIQNSGLQIPSGGAGEEGTRRQGIGGGRSLRWWFTQQAILLEGHGRFLDREDDADARTDFDALLEVVRKTRGETPVQGIVVTISAEDLIRHESARLDEQARVIRRRLDAARDGLLEHCPVYLVVSKADLVHGFQEFFQDLEGNARDQVCGATLSVEQMKEDADRVFSREFDQLYRSMCQRRIPRMVSEERPAVRGRVYLFPLEFQTLKRKLARFVKSVFEPDTAGRRPDFRGFYFGSGHVEGEPVEMVVNEVSRVIGLPPEFDDASDVTRVIHDLPAPAAAVPAPSAVRRRTEDGEPRFLRELFTRVLLMDAPLARPTEAWARRRRTRSWVLRGLGGLAVALLVTFLLVSFFRNHSLLNRTEELARDAAKVAGAPTNASDLENRLRQLEALRQQLEKLDRYDHRRPLTLGLGMYRGRDVNRRARAVYLNRLTEVFLGPSRAELESRLFVTYPQSPEEYQKYFESYRAYLMLIEPSRAEVPELSEELVEFWAAG